MRRFLGRLTSRHILGLLLFLVLVEGAGNLAATREQVDHSSTVQQQDQAAQRRQQRQEQAAQQRQGEIFERKLCSTFARAAALRPPAGNPVTNPSRAYLQGEHGVWVAVLADLDCPAPARP